MGAWGHGIYDNDAALDWVGELLDHGGSYLQLSLERYGTPFGIQCFGAHGCRILATADVVASLCGHSSGQHPDRLSRWLSETDFVPSTETVRGCQHLLQIVERPATSEIAKLWGEGTKFAQWLSTLRDVQQRLHRAAIP
ncbi:MAG: DUF4259 domain-containing protein [Myxococcales bacterium]|nr:DUF4259 domain-containing protein [Myxococcales bacterium]